MMRVLLSGLVLLPVAASASDYASQWPLTLPDGRHGAYEVVLTPAMYARVHRQDLRDLDVFDAQGRPVPALLLPPADPEASSGPDWKPAPWFRLPVVAEEDGPGIAAPSPAGPGRHSGQTPPADTGGALLVELGHAPATVVGLRLEWTPAAAPLDRSYRLSASDDLVRWRPVDTTARLVDLENAGRRVRRNQVRFAPVTARYLRLEPEATGPELPLTEVEAGVLRPAASPSWQWIGTERLTVDGQGGYRFQLPGRYPVEVADVDVGGGYSADLRLQWREGPDGSWRPAAAWSGYRVESIRGDRSPPVELRQVLRAREWRLEATPGAGDMPVNLRLGYRPERLVFLASGTPPYAVVAGSARSVRQDAPLHSALQALRGQGGPDWPPARASVGPEQIRGGPGALEPPAEPRDWSTWLLWGLLVAGTALVAGFSLRLLRRPLPPAG